MRVLGLFTLLPNVLAFHHHSNKLLLKVKIKIESIAINKSFKVMNIIKLDCSPANQEPIMEDFFFVAACSWRRR